MYQLQFRTALNSLKRFAFGMGAAAALLASQTTVLALPHPESKWRANPTNGDWDLAENWVPTRVPNAVEDQAVFDFSTITDVSTAFALVHSVNFNPGASMFTINGPITFNGGGVINDSGLMQTFSGTYRFQNGADGGNNLVTYNSDSLYFGKGTSAGSATFITNGFVNFIGGLREADHTTAGEATFINGGEIRFHKADAGTATFMNQGGTAPREAGGFVNFAQSGAGASTIINYGGEVFGARGATVGLHKSNGGTATLIAYGGAGPGSGGSIVIQGGSSGDLARIEVFDNGNLDVSRPDPLNDEVGSIEGTGLVFLGSSSLNVGANNLTAIFDGVISDTGGIKDGAGGSLIKSGTGTMTLTNDNTYTGGTTVVSGGLFVNNSSGSGTGSGTVEANAGTLGGNGAIAGPLTVGTGSGPGAFLTPGAKARELGTFTIQSTLTFRSDGTLLEELNSTAQSADEVTANGVAIGVGAQFSLLDLGGGSLPNGAVFTVIGNTSAAPITGTFANLANGSTLTVGGNKFRADYQGGDGNDLTLTVVP